MIRDNLWYKPGRIAGTICTPEEPVPRTPTLLFWRSRFFGQFALWTRSPLKLCKPSISGHFHLLKTKLVNARTHQLLFDKTHFKIPLQSTKKWQESSNSTCFSSSKILTLHIPSSSFQRAPTTACLVLKNSLNWNLSQESARYCRISLCGAKKADQSVLKFHANW